MIRIEKRRWRTSAAGVAVAAIALTGCAAIPGSGAVQPGLSDINQAEQALQFSAFGPSAGATQEELVRGFITAARSPVDDYSVAREYLSPEYADQWDPYFGVLVWEGSRPFRPDGDEAGMLLLSVVAEVDPDGRLLPTEAGESTELRFEFTKRGDEWRISSAPAGVIVDRATFDAIWSQHHVNFIGPGGRLVPDTRWFLSRPALSTEIVNALLAGPSERFELVARSGFPQGTTLTKNAVTVENGLARVDVKGEGLNNPGAQDEMQLQLQTSLQSVTGVNRVELLIDGTPVRSKPHTVTPVAPVQVGAKLAGELEGKFGVITASNVEPVIGVSARVEELDALAVNLSRSKTVAAVLAPDGVHIVAEGYSALVDSRKGLLAPSVDDDLWTWSVSATDPSAVRVASVDGVQHELDAPWLESLNVHAVGIAPGGSMLAALVDGGGGKSYVLVGGIIRDNEGEPTGLTPKADIEMWAGGEAIDFDWIDQNRFVAITRQGTAGKVSVGGPGTFVSEQGSVPDAVEVFGGGNRTQIRVLTASGELFAPQGASGWQRVAADVDLMAKRG
ncbi:sporulation and spore germination protein [Leucobacter komagatae]|uniref:Sporulation and spore germination protein n=1 Tax=Leucobacter komagatae TaxID=55969 RepID=A0A542Y6T5_9MICO|nr:LpqB family beta-propeller domain-containing protein [Leucobacter komagatae]TQL43755.1 sporulation and spore germination protein [Leucobacter komagatae]